MEIREKPRVSVLFYPHPLWKPCTAYPHPIWGEIPVQLIHSGSHPQSTGPVENFWGKKTEKCWHIPFFLRGREAYSRELILAVMSRTTSLMREFSSFRADSTLRMAWSTVV